MIDAMGTSKRSSLPKAMVMSIPDSPSSTWTPWIHVWVSIWLPLGSMPRMVRTVVASRVERADAPGDAEGAGLVGQGLAAGGDLVARHDELHDPGAGPGRHVDDGGARLGQRSRQGAERLSGQAVGDAVGLGVANEHGVDDLVDRAGTARVVGGVAHHLAPRQVQQSVRERLGRQVQGTEGLGEALQGTLGAAPPRSSRRRGSTPRP